MTGRLLFVIIVTAAMAALTWVMGWWGVLLGALVVGVVFRAEGGGGWWTGLAGALAWGALLLVDALSGPFAQLSRLLAGSMKAPAVALVAVTLLFPALLAWSASTLAAAIAGKAQRQTH